MTEEALSDNSCSSHKDKLEATKHSANIVAIKMSFETTQPATGPRSSPNKASEPSPLPFVLLLNGYPCVGKHSIAHLLSDRIPKMHIIDDLMLRLLMPEAIESGRGSGKFELCERIRKVIVDEIKSIEDESVTIVVTSCIDQSCPNELKEYVDVAARRKVPLIGFNITCEEREYYKRVESAKKMANHRSKVMSSKEMQKIRQEKTLILPNRDEFREQGAFMHHEVLDTTSMSVIQATNGVLRTLENVCNTQTSHMT